MPHQVISPKQKKTYLNYKKMAEQMDCPVRSDITDLYRKLIEKNDSI